MHIIVIVNSVLHVSFDLAYFCSNVNYNNPGLSLDIHSEVMRYLTKI